MFLHPVAIELGSQEEGCFGVILGDLIIHQTLNHFDYTTVLVNLCHVILKVIDYLESLNYLILIVAGCILLHF